MTTEKKSAILCTLVFVHTKRLGVAILGYNLKLVALAPHHCSQLFFRVVQRVRYCDYSEHDMSRFRDFSGSICLYIIKATTNKLGKKSITSLVSKCASVDVTSASVWWSDTLHELVPFLTCTRV